MNLSIVPISLKGQIRYAVTDGQTELAMCLTELQAQELITDSLGASTQVIRSEVTLDPPKARRGAYGAMK
jgi:hypothetical protein